MLANCNEKTQVPVPKSLQVAEQPCVMLMSSLASDKTCLHLYSEETYKLYSALGNLRAEILEGRTAVAQLGTNKGFGQWGGREVQSLVKGSWQQRESMLPMDCGNTVQYLHIRVGCLYPKVFWSCNRARMLGPSLGFFLLD